jgi:hypothetical protein
MILYIHLHLHAAIIRRTSGRILGTSDKEMLIGNLEYQCSMGRVPSIATLWKAYAFGSSNLVPSICPT